MCCRWREVNGKAQRKPLDRSFAPPQKYKYEDKTGDSVLIVFSGRAITVETEAVKYLLLILQESHLQMTAMFEAGLKFVISGQYDAAENKAIKSHIRKAISKRAKDPRLHKFKVVTAEHFHGESSHQQSPMKAYEIDLFDSKYSRFQVCRSSTKPNARHKEDNPKTSDGLSSLDQSLELGESEGFEHINTQCISPLEEDRIEPSLRVWHPYTIYALSVVGLDADQIDSLFKSRKDSPSL